MNLVQFMMFPALVPMLVSWLVAAYRDDRGSEPSGPRTESIHSRGPSLATAADAEDLVAEWQAAASRHSG
jgi:hypothetical protein